MAGTITTALPFLTDTIIQKMIEDQLYNDDRLLEKLRSQRNYQVGETARLAIHTDRNFGTTFAPPTGGTLNAAGQQGFQRADYDWANVHHQIRIEESAIVKTSSSEQAMAQLLDQEISGAPRDMKHQITRALWGNSDAKISATLTAGPSNVIQLNLRDGYNALVRGWLDSGMTVDIGTSADEKSLINNEQITSFSESATTPTITVSSAVSTVAGTHFVSLANARSGATSFEPNGMRSLVSQSSVFGNIDPAKVLRWKAALVDNTTTTLSIDSINNLQRSIEQRSDKSPNTILTSKIQEQKFYDLVAPQVRFMGELDGKMDVGNVGVPTYRGMEVVAHKTCPDEDFYMLDWDHLFLLVHGDPAWQNSYDGSGKQITWVQGTTAYAGKVSMYLNFGCNRRNAFARMGNLDS